jgi:hypothetical protein
MSWNYHRARERVTRSITEAPEIRVERFREDYWARIQNVRAMLGARTDVEPVIRDLSPGQAVLVDTVQVYVNVVNYNQMRLVQGQETAESHARALSFLHLHYAALDRASDGAGAQRIDFHGPRMHTVMLQTAGSDAAARAATVARALSLARRTIAISEAATRDVARSSITPLFRIGIDIGTCIAIDSGRSDEREPLFIGRAANHAAQLAEGDRPGVYLSDRVRALLGLPQRGSLTLERMSEAGGLELAALGASASVDPIDVRSRVDEVRETMRKHRDSTIGVDGFYFHHHQPPLRTIDYSALRPANSIRMPLVSIFADLDGYTRYVDEAMAAGNAADPVRDLHVIRSELNAVLQDDFEGRKVRFIGDCLHGLIAAGNSVSTDAAESVERATACAGALRSSFDLVLEHLPSARRLGLAVGLELGPTPISRIGIRGERSVRVASSVATLESERCQSLCTGSQTMIGERAYNAASYDTRDLFAMGRIATNLTFDSVVMSSPPAAKAAGLIAEPVVDNRSHGEP